MSRAIRTVLFLFLVFTFIEAYAGLTDLLDSAAYPDVRAALTDYERAEYDRIKISGNTITYDRPLIHLYLLASGVDNAADMQRYTSQYDALIKKAKSGLSAAKYNRYNTAEYLLHFLHDELFKNETAIQDNGFNIGIRETFDKGSFNCYKSALIYTSVLESFGYECYYVLVPMHIYCVVKIDGREIEVETTNRYGFDPHDRGAPASKRVLDKSGVIFDKKNYSNRQMVDTVSVVNIILNSRLLLYAGDMKHPSEQVPQSFERAAALGMAAFYINNGDGNIKNNLQNVLFHIADSASQKQTSQFAAQYTRMRAFVGRSEFAGSNDFSIRNLGVLAANVADIQRKQTVPSINSLPALAEFYLGQLEFVDQYIEKEDVHDNTQYGTLLNFYNDAKRYLNEEDLRSVEEYARFIKKVFYSPKKSSAASKKKYESMGAQFAIAAFSNHVAYLAQRRDYTQARRAAEYALEWLDDNDLYERESMRILEQNYKELKRVTADVHSR